MVAGASSSRFSLPEDSSDVTEEQITPDTCNLQPAAIPNGNLQIGVGAKLALPSAALSAPGLRQAQRFPGLTVAPPDVALTRISHELTTAAANTSVLTALCSFGLLDVL